MWECRISNVESMETSEAFDLTIFAATGALNTAQDLSRRVLESMAEADAEVVAEETLSLVATATARALEVGLPAGAEQEETARALLRLPFTYRDYLVGSAMLAREDKALADAAETIRARLARKQRFYTTHLPAGRFPGPRALEDKMALWMGRVSPPKLPEMPQERLEKLALVPLLVAHLKTVLAAARRHAENQAPG